MRFGSVCSGIEAASVAWHPLGWQAAWVSEIEPFPCSLLAHKYPETPNFGDMTQFKEWPNDPIDLLVGGTPCQSFSVAGLRKGMDDPRGNLALTYLAIADKYRPRWLVWENVPGVLSSNGGRDFGSFLGALGQLGFGFAYRVLDAQYFGVAQRRRRVFVVGYLGDWRRAAAVLFERESLSGHPAPSREAREEIAQCITTRTGSAYGPTTETLPISAPIAFESNMSLQTPSVNNVHPTLTRRTHAAVAFGWQNSAVRRLTPRECERLQGFPDDYTLVPHRNKPAADGPRYKSLGNSMAVPVMRWIGERIQHVEGI
jgi:DNA (cytosine-5)-methyltransferase 1